MRLLQELSRCLLNMCFGVRLPLDDAGKGFPRDILSGDLIAWLQAQRCL